MGNSHLSFNTSNFSSVFLLIFYSSDYFFTLFIKETLDSSLMVSFLCVSTASIFPPMLQVDGPYFLII